MYQADGTQSDYKTQQRSFHKPRATIRLAIAFVCTRASACSCLNLSKKESTGCWSAVRLRLRDVTFHSFKIDAEHGPNETAISIVNVHLRNRVNIELLRDC